MARGVIGFLLRRLAAAIPLALGVVTIVFVLLEAAPGDPADRLLGDRPIPPEVRERIERAYGLDRPPHERYVRWLSALLWRGELGWSHSRSAPVARAIGDALGPTLLLSGTALVLNVLLGIGLGVVSAARRGGFADRAITAGGLALYAMPTFWLGLMSVLLLGYVVRVFPTSHMHSAGAESWGVVRRTLDLLWHLALPASVLGVASAAATVRFVRAGVLEALGQDFVRAARARGLAERRLLLTHALRNALIPVVNLVGLSLPILVSGSLVIEVVFAWPGMGRLTYDAILADDHAVVLASTLLATSMVVAGSLGADLGIAAADPRVRLVRGSRRG